MSGAGAYGYGGIVATTDTGAAADNTAAAKAARRAALQASREGDQRVVRDAMETLISTGDLVPAADYDERDDEPGLPDEEQPDIGADDDDSGKMDGWDDDPEEWRDSSLTPSGVAGDEVMAVENRDPFRILVEDGACHFERPPWWNCKAITSAGQSFIADNERKFNLMTAIAEWLTLNRAGFLQDPDLWHLGLSARQEFDEGWASVVQQHFRVRAKLERFGDDGLFSRDISNTDLVFEDGSMGLGDLFGNHARMAWVAHVVKSIADTYGRNMEDVLNRYADVTVPRGERNALLETNVAILDFGKLIARACSLAGGNQPVSWAETTKRFRTQML